VRKARPAEQAAPPERRWRVRQNSREFDPLTAHHLQRFRHPGAQGAPGRTGRPCHFPPIGSKPSLGVGRAAAGVQRHDSHTKSPFSACSQSCPQNHPGCGYGRLASVRSAPI